ncbi:hypothetical protein [Methylocapsa sp. S129]|uniref:hypothetical protein n=1 Tax=Methylocapsa sp. S129 TaxID=1641869 RepID=UPI00131B9E99|nr:hypothetical protein [Methylocapsa sp. S129]
MANLVDRNLELSQHIGVAGAHRLGENFGLACGLGTQKGLPKSGGFGNSFVQQSIHGAAYRRAILLKGIV